MFWLVARLYGLWTWRSATIRNWSCSWWRTTEAAHNNILHVEALSVYSAFCRNTSLDFCKNSLLNRAIQPAAPKIGDWGLSQDEQALKRDVGWYGSFAMGYADVGADVYIALGLVALYAGGRAPLAFLVAAITYVSTGLAYAELATTYPYAGGAHIYSMKAFNDLAGFVAGWAVMLDYTVDI